MWGYQSIPMYFAAMAILMAVAASPILRGADLPPADKPARVGTLDGLRGILALAVYFHHALINRQFVLTREWSSEASHFYGALGIGSVAKFFMITGYLFWGKALRDGGCVDVPRLLIGRIFRIGPTYVVALAALLIGVGVATGFSLQIPALQFTEELAGWSALGTYHGVSMNGLADAWILLAGVTWTLQWEWGFYAALPLLALVFATPIKSRIALALSLPLVVIVTHRSGSAEPNLLIAFAIGMLCATWRRPTCPIWTDTALSVIALLAIVGAVSRPAFQTGDGFIKILPLLLLGGAFASIASGGSVFGLLTSRPARRLGDVSYPIYLLQGLVLTPFRATDAGRHLVTASPATYWASTILAALVLIGIATAVHVLVERPGIALGRSMRDRLPRSRAERIETSRAPG